MIDEIFTELEDLTFNGTIGETEQLTRYNILNQEQITTENTCSVVYVLSVLIVVK